MKNLNQKVHELLNLFKSRDFMNAEILVKETIKRYPKNAFLYNFLGLVLSELKRKDEARSRKKKSRNIKNGLIRLVSSFLDLRDNGRN